MKCRATQTKNGSPWRREGYIRNSQRARARVGPMGNPLQRQRLCVSICVKSPGKSGTADSSV